jgi:hypothetical protein
MEFNLILIFGDKPNGQFTRVDVVEDLIPSNAFTLSRRFNSPSPGSGTNNSPGAKMTPGMVLQWIYYEQLATTDYFFADRFGGIVFEWYRNPGLPSIDKHQGLIQKERSKTITRQYLKDAPPEESSHKKALQSISLESYTYRLLDEQNLPQAALFVESLPHTAFFFDLGANQQVFDSGQESPLGHYQLLHGVQVNTPGGQPLHTMQLPVELYIGDREPVPSSSVFVIPYAEGNQLVRLFAELHNRHPSSRPPAETPFPNSLRGLGHLELALPEPLSTDPSILEASDLILGYDMQVERREGVLFPFVVSHSREIPEGREIALHLEIYHLQKAADGFAEFSIDYQVVPARRMDWLWGTGHQVSLTIDQRIPSTRYSENLAIQTRRLEPSRYRLELVIRDEVSGQSLERQVEFEIVEAGDALSENQ